MCSVYTLLRVVSYYDLSVLSMSVRGLQKNVLMGVGGWGELHAVLFWIFWNILNCAKPVSEMHRFMTPISSLTD